MKKEKGAFDIQVGGDHYKKMKIQPTEYILANKMPFCEGNIVKYISRWRDKNGLQDLEKVIHYAQILIDNELSMMNDEIKDCKNCKSCKGNCDG